MGIKTSVLPYQIMSDFIADISNNNYFVFASSVNNVSASSNSLTSAKLFLEKTIFGKKITSTDVKYMIPKRLWEPNIVYDQYDDTKDLTTLDFYVISEPDSESGDYNVFKCLDNNSGGVSVEKPTYNSDLSLSNYILRTSDNYIWKFLYAVKSSEYSFYRTKSLFPIIDNSDVQLQSKSGIDLIIVENPDNNYGYESLASTVNTIGSDVSGSRRIFINIASDQTFNPTTGYYKDYSFYVSSSNGVTSKLYVITNSGIRSSDQRPYVEIANYNGEITNIGSVVWNYSILPRVEIIGDGSGATAIPLMNGPRIKSIQILTNGTNYTRASARIVKPNLGFDPASSSSGDITCKLRVVKAPGSCFAASTGHGSNPAIELNSRYVLLTTELTGVDDLVIPTSNTYSKIGLVRNPEFTSVTSIFDNRIKVRVSSVNQLSVGGVITQTNSSGSLIFRGIIHAIDDINNFIYLTEFFGPYYDQSETTNFYLSSYYIDPSRPLVSTAGNVDIVANNIEPIDAGIFYPKYVQNTGRVMYITDFEPVERSNNLTEQYKFIIEF